MAYPFQKNFDAWPWPHLVDSGDDTVARCGYLISKSAHGLDCTTASMHALAYHNTALKALRITCPHCLAIYNAERKHRKDPTK